MPRAVANRLTLAGVIGRVTVTPKNVKCRGCGRPVIVALEDFGGPVGSPVVVAAHPTTVDGEILAFLYGIPTFAHWGDRLIRRQPEIYGFARGNCNGIHPMHLCAADWPVDAKLTYCAPRAVDPGPPPF